MSDIESNLPPQLRNHPDPKGVITKAFLKNMSSLGMHVMEYACDGKQAYVWLQFEHVYPMVRFIEYVVWGTDYDFAPQIFSNWVSFEIGSMSKVKRIIADIARKRGIDDDDTDWASMEVTAGLNKISNILLNEMGLSEEIEFECEHHRSPTGLANTVAPENRAMLKVLLALLPNLIPVELGAVEIHFQNSTSGLYFDPLGCMGHDHGGPGGDPGYGPTTPV